MEISVEWHERILAIGDRVFDKKKLAVEEKQFLISAYYKQTGNRLHENCSNCYIKIYQYFKQLNTNSMENLQFKLKEGKKIALYGMTDVVTNANLTNDKAVNILRRCPGCINMFEVVPKDWAGMVKQVAKKAEAPAKPQTVMVASQAPELNTSEFPLEAMRLENLQAKTNAELKAMCKHMELDEATYKYLNKADLVALLMDKTA